MDVRTHLRDAAAVDGEGKRARADPYRAALLTLWGW